MSRVLLQPGKDREGYWTSEYLINQVKTNAIPIFETLFPNCIGLFAFDNSSNYAAFKSDALIASKMNLKPGGKHTTKNEKYSFWIKQSVIHETEIEKLGSK